MSDSNRQGPRALSAILGELFTVRGYGRLRTLGELEKAWNQAVGEPYCCQTRVGDVRRGVLNVTVAHPTLLEELMAFRKPELLNALRNSALAMTIRDIRFRVGPVGDPDDQPVNPLEYSPQTPSPSRTGTTISPGFGQNQQRSRAREKGHKQAPGEG